jgi:thiamine biosynthesis lipoprotein
MSASLICVFLAGSGGRNSVRILTGRSPFWAACCLALFLAGCVRTVLSQEPGEKSSDELSGFEMTFPAMGTMLAFQAFGDNQQQVEACFADARREVERLVEILSDYGAESETVLLSRPELVGQWQTTSPELWDVLQVCDRWHRQTAGAFDASVGRLSALWRNARKSKTIPTQAEIDRALTHCGWQHVQLDPATQRIKLDIEGLKLDFGALGKGYIIDKAYARLAACGLSIALVRAGGDLRCGAPPPGRRGWPIEITKIAGNERLPPRLMLANAAVSSSGDLYQFIEIAGRRRSHVLDPRTGIGVPGPRLVTVIAPTSTEADAADTALCVMQDQAALNLAQQVGNIEVRIASVAEDGKAVSVHTTPGFERYLLKETDAEVTRP